MEFEHTPGRYAGLVDGTVVTTLDYRDDGLVRAMTHTFTDPRHRGQGHADRIVEHAVATARAEGRLVSPACWYVAAWFDRHPDQASLLAS